MIYIPFSSTSAVASIFRKKVYECYNANYLNTLIFKYSLIVTYFLNHPPKLFLKAYVFDLKGHAKVLIYITN